MLQNKGRRLFLFMSQKTEEKKTMKEKLHDYFMEQSKIAPIGLNDKEDKYYHSIFNYDK